MSTNELTGKGRAPGGRRGIGGHQHANEGGKDEWLTPPGILTALGAPDGFALDPCAPVTRPWPTARSHFTIFDDGLKREWVGRVWLNPPYGNKTAMWLARLAAHGDGVALIFARTETTMFHEHVFDAAHGVLFLRGRLDFHHVSGRIAEHNAGGPSCLIAYGEGSLALLRACGLPGRLVTLR